MSKIKNLKKLIAAELCVALLASLLATPLPAQAAFIRLANRAIAAPVLSTAVTHASISTSATGANWVTLAAQAASSIEITNNTGTTIEVQRNGAGEGLQVATGLRKTFSGITNASQLAIRRTDTSNTQVVVTADISTTVSTADLPAQTNSIEALSLDRLYVNYTGPAIQVRRTSDNILRDIGFNSAGRLDTRALLSFCGNGCTVRTWYDQDGLNNDVTQTTTANQPTIVANGNLMQTQDGRPALFFDGVNDSLGNAGTGFPTGAGAFTANVRLKFADRLSAPTRTYLKWGAESLNTGLIMTRDTNSDMRVRTGDGQYEAFLERNDSIKSMTLINSGSTFTAFYNGYQSTLINLPPTYNIIAGNFTIGTNAITFASPFLGTISEVLVYNTALTETQRIALELNQNQRNNVKVTYNLIFDGDSITRAGLGTGGGAGNVFAGWPYRLMDLLTAQKVTFNAARIAPDGQSATTQDTAARASTGIDNMQFQRAVRTILFAMLGKNDIGNEGNSPAQAYADYVTYVTNRKATGKYDRIVVFTTTPSVSDAASLNMTAFSNLVRNGMKTVASGGTGELLTAGATDLVDLQLADDGTGYKPFLDPAGWNNATYIHAPDKIHPTDAGQTLIFNQVRATLGL